MLRYLEMVLFIEEDCGRAASKVAKKRKIEEEADESEYRVGCHRRIAFQPGEIPCNVSSRDYKYSAVKKENNDDSLARLARDSIFRKASLYLSRLTFSPLSLCTFVYPAKLFLDYYKKRINHIITLSCGTRQSRVNSFE